MILGADVTLVINPSLYKEHNPAGLAARSGHPTARFPDLAPVGIGVEPVGADHNLASVENVGDNPGDELKVSQWPGVMFVLQGPPHAHVFEPAALAAAEENGGYKSLRSVPPVSRV